MTNNPFTSKIYEVTWLKYFAKSSEAIAFNFVDGLKFYKHAFLPYYINVGRNLTNGISYSIDYNARDYKSKTLLIYDVPSYYLISPPSAKSPIKLKCVRQYKGYLANFEKVNSFDKYLQENLNSGSRNKYRGAIRKLEKCFDVDYKIYKNFISKEDYSKVIQDFKQIITKRFETLKLDTNLIKEWPFYTELIYKMILDDKALLISIYANKKPVSMSLCFLSDDSIIGAIKAFDSDFYKFNVGHIEIGKLIEYCINNKLKYFDFSKGTYKYKDRWTNSDYDYNCHILYDSSNSISRLTAKILANFFSFKQYLRDKNFNLFLVKLKFKFKNLKPKSNYKFPYKILEFKNDEAFANVMLVSLNEENKQHPFLKRIVLDKLFQNPEPFKNLKFYKSTNSKPMYFVVGIRSRYKILIK